MKNIDFNNYSPSIIKSHLDKYVIGQDEVKKYLSISVYNHYKRLIKEKYSNIEIDKSNILIIGPTGTGKTLLAKTIAKIIKVPFSIADATCLTEAGYVGEDVESILSKLLQSSGYDINKTEIGIIYIDEIDKIAKSSNNISISRDVSGEGVQQALLKIIEGGIINIPPHGGRKHPEQVTIPINTRNILFIAGGTFSGIKNIVNNRLKYNDVGFNILVNNNNNTNKSNSILPVDIKNYGFIPEFIGRFPIITQTYYLTYNNLKDIMLNVKNSVFKQYYELFNMDNVRLKIFDNAIDYIINYCIKLKLGARGLKNIFEKILMDYMYNIDKYNNKTIYITLEIVSNILNK